VVDILTGPHDHLKGWNGFSAGCTKTRRSKHSQIISFAEYEVSLLVERVAHLAEATVTTGTLEAVLMPQLVERFEQEAFPNGLRAGSTQLTGVGRGSGRLVVDSVLVIVVVMIIDIR